MLCWKGKPTWSTPVRCWPWLRRPQVWPGEAPRCMPAARMSLCGFGLLCDSLGKIIGRASLWRPPHPQKPDVAPGLLVPRPCSAQRPIPLLRSVHGSALGRVDSLDVFASAAPWRPCPNCPPGTSSDLLQLLLSLFSYLWMLRPQDGYLAPTSHICPPSSASLPLSLQA